MICDQLKRMKEERHLSTKQLADLSGLPESSISRILSGQTDSPGFQTVAALVKAMGGSLDELTGGKQKDGPKDKLIELYEHTIAAKDKWVARLFIICCAMVLVFIGIVIFDVMHSHVGFVRY